MTSSISRAKSFAALFLILMAGLHAGLCGPAMAQPRRPVVVRKDFTAGGPKRFVRPKQPKLDSHASKTASNTITLSGTSEKAAHVVFQVRGGKRTRVAVTDALGRFTADVRLLPNRLNRIVVTGEGALSGPSIEVEVIQDSAPPKVTIEYPNPFSDIVTSGTIVQAYGRIEDLTASCGLEVQFDNGNALVHFDRGTTGTFSMPAAQLRPDPTRPQDPTAFVLVYTVEDSLGNSSEETVYRLRRAIPGANQKTLSITDGNHQFGLVETELPIPLQVCLNGPGNHAGKIVTFQVVAGNGSIAGADPESGTAQVRTGIDGKAVVRFTLGKLAGAGVHRVRAESTGYEPRVIFVANGLPRSALVLHQASGTNFVGEAGTVGEKPIRVRVTDGRRNGIGNIAVTFKIVSGKATFRDGSRETTFLTDSIEGERSRGRARVEFRYGPGNGVSKVSATAPGLMGSPILFDLRSVTPRMVGGVTLVSGIARDEKGSPIENGPVRIEGLGWKTSPTGKTDNKGRYRIKVTESGPATVKVSTPNVQIDASTTTSKEITIIPGRNNRVSSMTVISDALATAFLLNDQRNVTITSKITGTIFHIPPGSAIHEDGTPPTPQNPFLVGVREVPIDKSTDRLPNDVRPLIAFELRSDKKVLFDVPLEFTTLNLTGLSPGTIVDVWGINPASGFPEVVGHGKVSKNGKVIFAQGIRQTGVVAIAGREARKTTVQGQLDTTFQPTMDLCGALFHYDLLAAIDCSGLFDGTLAGFQSSVACINEINVAVDQLKQTVQDNQNSSVESPRILGALVKDITTKLLTTGHLLHATGESSPPRSDMNVNIMDFEGIKTDENAPVTIFTFTVTVSLDNIISIDIIEPGYAVEISPSGADEFQDRFRELVPGAFAQASATIEVTSVHLPFGSNPSFSGQVRVVVSQTEVVKTVRANGVESTVSPDGSFNFQVPVIPGVHVQPEIDVDFVPLLDGFNDSCSFSLSAPNSLPPVLNGTTDFPLILLTDLLNPTIDLSVSPSSLMLTENDFSGVNVTAFHNDGSMVDVTADFGTTYISSNRNIVDSLGLGAIEATGGGEANVTATHDGQVAVVDVNVTAIPQSTTVEGIVALSNGTPVSGATVTINPDGVTTTSDTNGLFSLTFTPMSQDRVPLTVVAERSATPDYLAGQADGFLPRLNLITDVGVIIVEPAHFWIDDVSGNSHDPSKWNLNTVPGPNDTAVIDQPGDNTITISSDFNVKKLICREVLAINFSGSLTVEEPFVLDANVEFFGGKLIDTMFVPGGNGGQIDIRTTATFDKVDAYMEMTVTGGKRLIVKNGLGIFNALNIDGTTDGATLELIGTDQTVYGTGWIELLDGPGPFGPIVKTFAGDDLIEVDITGSGRIEGKSVLTGSVTSDGLIELTGEPTIEGNLKATDASFTVDGNWTNRGAIEVTRGTLRLNGQGWQDGTICVVEGDLIVAGEQYNFLRPLTVRIDANSQIFLEGDFDLTDRPLDLSLYRAPIFLSGGTLSGGDITGDAHLWVVNDSTFAGIRVGAMPCIVIENGRTLSVTGTLQHEGYIDLASTGTNTSLLFLDSEAWVNGAGVIELGADSSQNRVLPTQGSTLNLGSNITVYGGRGFIGSSFAGSNTINHGTVVATDQNGPLNLNIFENRGTMRIDPGASVFSNFPILQTSGETINNGRLSGTAGFTVQGGEVSGTGEYLVNVINLGRFRAGTGSLQITAFDTQGTLEVDLRDLADFGNLLIGQGASFAGDLQINLLDGYVPKLGDRFRIADYASFSGGFGQVFGGGGDLEFLLYYLDTHMELEVSGPQ